MSQIKTPREIMIKHWIVRMKEVYGVDVDESDFKKEEPGWQFMLKAIEDFHNQHKPSDEEIIEIAKQWSVKENPKEDVIASQIIKALNILCDKIFKL